MPHIFATHLLFKFGLPSVSFAPRNRETTRETQRVSSNATKDVELLLGPPWDFHFITLPVKPCPSTIWLIDMAYSPLIFSTAFSTSGTLMQHKKVFEFSETIAIASFTSRSLSSSFCCDSTTPSWMICEQTSADAFIRRYTWYKQNLDRIWTWTPRREQLDKCPISNDWIPP